MIEKADDARLHIDRLMVQPSMGTAPSEKCAFNREPSTTALVTDAERCDRESSEAGQLDRPATERNSAGGSTRRSHGTENYRTRI
jgi:hypothetical protein